MASPNAHEQSIRLQYALSKLPEKLPAPAQKVIDDLFLSKLPSSTPSARNEEYLQKHKDSATAVFAVVKTRQAINAEGSNSIKLIQDTLQAPNTTIQEAVQGLRLLDDIKADAAIKLTYIKTAHERWPQATVFA